MSVSSILADRSAALRNLIALIILAAVLATALVIRLPKLDSPSSNYDEGVYLQSLLLMRRGYRVFSDIVATQGPIHLYLAYPSYALGGYTLAAARAGAVAAALVAVLAVAWSGYRLGGRVGGVAAALALALSPGFLIVSRRTLPEAPALALAAIAVGAAAWAHHTDRDRWRVVAGLFLGLGCLVKPTVAPAALAVLLLTIRRGSLRSTLLSPMVAILTGIAGLAAVGAAETASQVIGWRLQSGQIAPTSAVVWRNAELLVESMLDREQPAFYALAAVGGLALIGRSWRAGLAIVGWLVAQLLLLILYTNLSPHHGATLLVPLSVLVGVGLATGWSAVARRDWRRPAAGAALVALWYAGSLPAILHYDYRLAVGNLSADEGFGKSEREAVDMIEELTTPDDFVLTDAPGLAFLADRMVPPSLVDPSEARIRAGAVTAHDVLAALAVHDLDLVVFWTGRLAQLTPVVDAVASDFVLVERFRNGDSTLPRAIYRDPAGHAD